MSTTASALPPATAPHGPISYAGGSLCPAPGPAGTVTTGATAGFLLIATAFPRAVPALLALTALLVVASLAGALFLLPRRGASAVPSGPETPPGPRWEIAGLAQLPGTRLTAVQTVRWVLATVPPARAVVVAAASTPAQYEQYLRFGFTGGEKRRVYRIIPEHASGAVAEARRGPSTTPEPGARLSQRSRTTAPGARGAQQG